MTWCQDDECSNKDQIDASRSDALYCSAACRQRAYRRRKRLLAPYDGDADRALSEALTGLRELMQRGVTDKRDG